MTRFMSLKDHVYQFISEKITDGTLAPEGRINEQLICDELNISRTPVREALIQLAAEGYIENLPRKGFIVKSMSEKKALELYAIIGILDSLAAELALARITERHLKEMNTMIAAMDQAITDHAPDIYNRHQYRFHEIYTEQCGNESLIQLLEQQKRHFMQQQFSPSVQSILDGVLRETNDEHREILKLFRQKDAAALTDYIRNVHWRADRAVFDAG